jgi:capsular exopolysaccharide synthesis family protein
MESRYEATAEKPSASRQPTLESDLLRSGGANSSLNTDGFLLEYVTVVRKHRWSILAATIVVLTMSTISALRAVPLYVATGRIAVNRETPVNLGFKDSEASAEDFDSTVTLETQVRILQSRILAAEVAKGMRAQNNPAFVAGGKSNPMGAKPFDLNSPQDAALAGRVQGSLGVRVLPGTRVIEIQCTDPNPRMAADIVNQTIATYIEQNYKTKFEATMQTSDWIAHELTDLKLKMETSQAELIRYQKENNIFGVDDKQNLINSALDDLGKRLTQAQADRILKESLYKMTAEGHADLFAKDPAGGSMIGKLRDRQSELRTQYAQLRTQFGPSYPKLVEIDNQLKQLQTDLDAENDLLSLKLKSEYLAAMEQEKLLSAALEDQKKKSNELNRGAIQYNIVKRDAETYRSVYEGLLQKMKEAGVSIGLRSNNIRIVDSAWPPSGPVSPNVPRSMAMGLILGLLAGLGLAFVLESLDNTIRVPEQAQAIAGVPSFGVIPLGSSTGSGRDRKFTWKTMTSRETMAIVTLARPKSDMSESYRSLRTSILLSSFKGPPKLLLITSPLPGEGKTTTSVNTAIVLAQKGSRVLLIDGDLRRPTIHKAFNIPSRPGLSDLLAGTVDPAAVIRQTSVANLSVIPAGTIPPQPAELLGSAVMRDCLNRWKEEYDFTLVDSPPVLSVTDAVLLSAEVDAVLLVLRAGHTTKTALRRARSILGQVNAKVIGTVLNGLDVYGSDYQYYYYGKYYGSGSNPSQKYYSGDHAHDSEETHDSDETTVTRL